jgi:hypothetical protein
VKRTLNQRLGFTPVKKEPSFVYYGDQPYLDPEYRPARQMDNIDRMMLVSFIPPEKQNWWKRIFS